MFYRGWRRGEKERLAKFAKTLNTQLLTQLLLLLLFTHPHTTAKPKQVRCEGVGRHTVLGTTIDDSLGEAFDKVARLLGITAVPGG